MKRKQYQQNNNNKNAFACYWSPYELLCWFVRAEETTHQVKKNYAQYFCRRFLLIHNLIRFNQYLYIPSFVSIHNQNLASEF